MLDRSLTRGATRHLDAPSVPESLMSRHFALFVLLTCLAYLALEAMYVTRLPLVMDEFQGASSVAQFGDGMPYRDFRPYKTVVGYYVQLPALLLGAYPWFNLLSVKFEMAILSAIAMAFAAFSLAKHFRKEAICFALVVLAVMSTFVERSAELRVDMLTSWAGLGSLLLLLDRRGFSAGALAGLSFLISQKGIYYILAGEVAILALWLLKDRVRETGWRVAAFAVAATVVLVSYVLVWSLFSSVSSVLTAMFVAPRVVAFENLYEIRQLFWTQTILRNPLFYAVGLFGLIHMVRLVRSGVKAHRATLLAWYGLTLFALGLWHRQPWPYFFLLLIPTVFVLIVAFFDSGLGAWRGQRRLGMTAPMMAVYLTLGVAYPLTRVPVNFARSNAFQREMVELSNGVLQSGDTYLAGVNLLPEHKQPVGSLSWLDEPTRLRLQRASARELAAIVDSLERAPLKLVVDNYRLKELPPRLRAFVDANYSTLWGNILIYAPWAADLDGQLTLKFSGDYLVDAPGGLRVSIDGKTVTPAGRVWLERGLHRYESDGVFRLKLQPEGWQKRARAETQAPRNFFPNVYTY
jgi:hypothetical protein